MFAGGIAGLVVQWVLSSRSGPRSSPSGQNEPNVKRNVIPPLSFAVVGLVLSQHTSQFTTLSATLHSAFGQLLLLASIARIISLAPSLAYLEHLGAFFVLCAGLVLISAYDEWVDLLILAGIDRWAYLAAVCAFAILLVGWTWFWAGVWLSPSSGVDDVKEQGYSAISENGTAGNGELVGESVFHLGRGTPSLDFEDDGLDLKTLNGQGGGDDAIGSEED